MKTQMKMLIASIAVFALAMTAVSGITYSWFSDEERAQIDIKMGKVSIDVVYGDAKIYETNDESGPTETTDKNKTATIIDSGKTVSVTLKNIASGDKVVLPFTIKNNSTIDCKYRYSVTTDKNLGFGVKVDCGGRTIIDQLESQWDNTIVKPTDAPVTGTFTIEIPVDYTSQGKNASYEFTISAYQYNASVSAPYSGTYNIVGMKRAVDNYYDGAASYIEVWSAEGLVNVINDYNKILEDLAKNVGGVENGVYLNQWQVRLLKDLDFNNVEMKSLPFPYGSLDGQGHTIKNVRIVDNTNTKVGLFQTIGSVSDLTIEKISVESSVKDAWIGTVAGYTSSLWSNVHVKNFSVKTTESSDDNTTYTGAYVGGLVGDCYGTMYNCTVSDGTVSGGKNVGGFAGLIGAEGGNLEIKDCSVSKVEITNTEILENRTSVGSFVGRINNSGSSITLSDCSATNVTGINVPSERIYGDIPSDSVTINNVVCTKYSKRIK